MPVDPRTIIAAGNNADLYGAVLTAQGCRFSRLSFAFVAHEQPPPCYGNMTVLAPDYCAGVLAELAGIAENSGDGMAIKDSFCELDLTCHGFEIMFSASWIWRRGGVQDMPDGWSVIDTAPALEKWEAAWKAGGSETPFRMFPPEILTNGDVVFLGLRDGDGFAAGCMANRSPDCIGLSNLFARDGDAGAIEGAANAVAAIGKGAAIVGYEAGDTLTVATNAGFETVGDLRVWGTQAARF